MRISSPRMLDESASARKAANDKVTLLYKRARNGAQPAKCLCYIALLVRSGMRAIGAAFAIAMSGATDPVVITRENAAAAPAPVTAAGTNEFKLIGIEEFDLGSRKDRLVSVEGVPF